MDIGRNFFRERVAKRGNRLPGAAVEPPSLAVSTRRVNVALRDTVDGGARPPPRRGGRAALRAAAGGPAPGRGREEPGRAGPLRPGEGGGGGAMSAGRAAMLRAGGRAGELAAEAAVRALLLAAFG